MNCHDPVPCRAAAVTAVSRRGWCDAVMRAVDLAGHGGFVSRINVVDRLAETRAGRTEFRVTVEIGYADE
jgi:hypothetical protein